MRYHEIIESNTGGTFKVFHGTDAQFRAFDASRLGSANGSAPINMSGFNFTDNEEVAHSFGKHVISCLVTIHHPKIIDAKGQNYSTFKHTLSDILDSISRSKYDGIIIRNYMDAGKYSDEYIMGNHYIPFSTDQISHIISEDVVLWHGGRDLESSYDEVRSHKGGRWEHGPGLYLTTHFDTAAKYAKGGGKLYKVTLKDGGTDIDNVVIPLSDAVSFVNRYVIGSKRKIMISDLEDNAARHGETGVQAEVLINLCLNHAAISNTKTNVLRQFLIDQGVDYAKVSRYGGRDENVLVVINPRIIKKVEVVSASNVKQDEFVKPFLNYHK